MSVERFTLTQNGQEVEQSDINAISDAGGLADDHVLAELLRLAPFSGSGAAKAILPFGTAATVAPAGATGSVTVSPFRAVVGSRDTAANIGTLKNWNDLRSAIFTGPNALALSQQLQANTTAQPRWDLLYAQLQVEQPGAQVSRYRKDPATEQVTVVQVAKSLVQAISVSVVQGTSGGPKPTLPPDGGGTFFFPLANVRVPANFGPLSTVASTDIEDLAPYVPLSLTTGASILVPANHQYKEGGSVLSSAAFAWGSGGPRPGPVIPPTMSGCEGRLIAIDVQNAASANWSHQSGSVVDDSRDWRNRVFRWHAIVNPSAQAIFPWDHSGTPPSRAVAATGAGATNPYQAFGFGQSFAPDGATVCVPPLSVSAPVAAQVTPANATLPANTYVVLAVDPGSGALKVYVNGVPGVRVFFWLEASGQYPNA
ncbi:MAG TPA: hypothetical protein VGG39_37835 [Polyangiaceae bacterium]|jgi:hypothetical protein